MVIPVDGNNLVVVRTICLMWVMIFQFVMSPRPSHGMQLPIWGRILHCVALEIFKMLSVHIGHIVLYILH